MHREEEYFHACRRDLHLDKDDKVSWALLCRLRVVEEETMVVGGLEAAGKGSHWVFDRKAVEEAMVKVSLQYGNGQHSYAGSPRLGTERFWSSQKMGKVGHLQNDVGNSWT